MKWDYWIALYINTHCVARGLRALTIKAYEATLKGFRQHALVTWPERGPDQLSACDILQYLEHLRKERHNGASALNRQATVLRNFYRAMVAMGHLEPRLNPMAYFPKIKPAARKLPSTLDREEVSRLLDQPSCDTVLGLRDRAVLTLLYGTGIRASECAGLAEKDINWDENLIRVVGKGGHERTIPLNDEVVHVLRQYRLARGATKSHEPFFRSREGGALSRNAIYERVRGLHKRLAYPSACPLIGCATPSPRTWSRKVSGWSLSETCWATNRSPAHRSIYISRQKISGTQQTNIP